MNITAQVAEVTKPLAAANEVVDATLSGNQENWIILNKRGGAITTVSAEARRKIIQIPKEDAKPMVPILRENNSFIIEIFVDDKEEEQNDWNIVKNGNKMHSPNRWNKQQETNNCDTRNRYAAFWTEDCEGEDENNSSKNNSSFTRQR